jgi:hypothetical protein
MHNRVDHPMTHPRGYRRPSPPEIPDDYQLTAQWRTGPTTASLAVEVWGRRIRRDALLRVIDDAGAMDAGTVVAGGTDAARVDWTEQARAEYGEDWLDAQGQAIVKHLAIRWGEV